MYHIGADARDIAATTCESISSVSHRTAAAAAPASKLVLKTDFDAGAEAAAVNVVALTVTNMPQPSAVDATVNFTNPPQDKA